MGTTVKTSPVGVALVRKWSAHLRMPATKNSRHQIPEFGRYGCPIHLADTWRRHSQLTCLHDSHLTLHSAKFPSLR